MGDIISVKATIGAVEVDVDDQRIKLWNTNQDEDVAAIITWEEWFEISELVTKVKNLIRVKKEGEGA